MDEKLSGQFVKARTQSLYKPRVCVCVFEQSMGRDENGVEVVMVNGSSPPTKLASSCHASVMSVNHNLFGVGAVV